MRRRKLTEEEQEYIYSFYLEFIERYDNNFDEWFKELTEKRRINIINYYKRK